MIPVWGEKNVFHALVYIENYAYGFEYSFDGTNWTALGDIQTYYQTFEGWTQLALNFDNSGFLVNNSPFYIFSTRSSQAKQGFAFVTGNVANNESCKMSMPVNGDGWWASPRFKADGEIRAYARIFGWKSEFTIHNGKLFWCDSDIPNSWAIDKGADYSVQGKAGQKLYVNFTTGEALVSTPNEVPFPLENPVFRTTSTVNVSVDDPTLCTITGDNGNTAQLYWDAIDGASGYRIKMAYQEKVVAGGSEVWDNADNILIDQTVDASTTSLSIPNLDYSTS